LSAAGSILIYKTDVFHRGSNFKAPGRSRFVMPIDFKKRGWRWQGKLADEREVMVMLKTRSARLDSLRAAFDELHPYKVPELLALPVEAGTEKYLEWINGETTLALT